MVDASLSLSQHQNIKTNKTNKTLPFPFGQGRAAGRKSLRRGGLVYIYA